MVKTYRRPQWDLPAVNCGGNLLLLYFLVANLAIIIVLVLIANLQNCRPRPNHQSLQNNHHRPRHQSLQNHCPPRCHQSIHHQCYRPCHQFIHHHPCHQPFAHFRFIPRPHPHHHCCLRHHSLLSFALKLLQDWLPCLHYYRLCTGNTTLYSIMKIDHFKCNHKQNMQRSKMHLSLFDYAKNL